MATLNRELPAISRVVSYSSGEDLTHDHPPVDNPLVEPEHGGGDLVTSRRRRPANKADVNHTIQILDTHAHKPLPTPETVYEREEGDQGLIDILPPIDPLLAPEYEIPLCDCLCCEVYWSPFFAKLMKRLFRIKLKCRSKKGTPSYGNRKPRKRSRFVRSMGEVAEGVRRKSVMARDAISREWKERRPLWNYQDTTIQEMELELQRLRRQIRDSTVQGGGGEYALGEKYNYSIPQHLVGIPQHLLGMPAHLAEGLGGPPHRQGGSVRAVTWCSEQDA